MSTEYLTIKQAAKILGVTALTLRNWDKSGKFSATRHPINNYRVYKKSQIERFMESMSNKYSTTRNTSSQSPRSTSPTNPHPKKLSVRHED